VGAGGLGQGQARIACPIFFAASVLVLTCSMPIAVEVAYIDATITTIRCQVAIVLPNITRIAPEVALVGAQFCSRRIFVPVSPEFEQISLTLPSICAQVAAIRADISRIRTNIATVAMQIPALSAIDTPLLGHDNIG